MILGHKEQIEILERFLTTKKIFQPFLFWGPEKIGKKTVAIEFLKKIFSQDPFSHPDFLFVFPQSNQISIEKVREIISFLSLTPLKAEFKAVVCDDCHLFTIEAQQCFLKTLEEPKGKSIIILITSFPEKLLPTILSRCLKIRFFQPSRNEIEEFLVTKNLSQKEIEEILKFSFLKPAKIFEFLKDPKALQLQKEKIEEIRKIIKAPLSLRFNFAKRISEKENILEILRVWLIFFRAHFLAEIKQGNFDKKFLKLKEILFELSTLEIFALEGKINKRLALENFFLRL